LTILSLPFYNHKLLLTLLLMGLEPFRKKPCMLNNTPINNTYIKLFCSIAFCLSLFVPGEVSGTESPCMECHDDLYAESLENLYIHTPFLEKNCEICHDSSMSTSSGSSVSSAKKAQNSGPKMTWLTKGGRSLSEHWLLLPVPESVSEFVLGVNGTGKKHSKLVYTLPPFDDLPEIENDKKGPQIDKVMILAMQRSIFITATIGWETDEISDAQIKYSLKKKQFLSAVDSQLGKSHQLTLMGLKAKKKYRFSVISKDIYGNESVLGPYVLNTKKAKDGSGKKSEKKKKKKGSEVEEKENEILTEFYKIPGNYLIKVNSSEEKKIFLGLKSADESGDGDEDSGVNEDMDPDHLLLTDPFELNTQQCYICHNSYKELSHPVNVFPKPGMVIPPEYPTLPDGRISCMTCHNKHGSNNPFRTLKEHNRDLCIGCHKEMI